MADDLPSIRIDGDEKTIVTATWGRSGKRAIVTVSSPHHENSRQVVLTPEQADALGRFLSAGPHTS